MSIKLLTASLCGIVSFLFVAQPTLADAPVPVEEIVRELDSKVRMPIVLPDRLPRIDQVYPAVNIGFSGRSQEELYYANDYWIDFNTKPSCEGGPDCRFASFSASLGGNFLFATDSIAPNMTIEFGDRLIEILEVRRIELVDEYGDRIEDVQFTRQCGLPAAPCGTNEMVALEWLYGGIKYRVAVVDGTLEEAVQIANSAMQGGVRNRVKLP